MRKSKKIIIPHVNIDYDALASTIAAKKLYPDAEIVLHGTKEKSMKNFFINTIIYSLNVKTEKDIDLNEVNTLIIVDTSNRERIGKFASLLDKKDVKVILYDHHLEEKNINGDEEYIEKTGSCTTILVKKLKELNITLNEIEATILMMGIYEDTGNLTFNTTTEEDYYSAAYLLRFGANLNIVRDILYHDITEEQIEILKQFIDTEQKFYVNNTEVTVVQATSDKFIPEVSVSVNKFKDMKNLPVLIALIRLENKVIIIIRSSDSKIDAQKIAEHFGGGGHQAAASAIIKDKTLIQVYNELKEYLTTLDKSNLLAKDIMTWPVKYIYENQSIIDAELLLNRYNINVLPVLNENNELTGLITRLIVAKALYHRLKNLKVKDIMIKEFQTVSPDDSFSKVKDIILKENQRLLPVVKNGELVGVITRTDILKTLYQLDKEENKQQASDKVFEKDLKNLIKSELPEEIVSKLELMGEIAEKLNYRIYLVGGIVRDLLLRQPNYDVDLVVEGDGIIFAKKVQKELNIVEKIKTHEKFKTATIFFKDNIKFDIATARTEYYKKPGSLPIVEQSSLKLDLYRRDFTINALAIEITKKNFGKLIDFFSGLKDLKDKKIRVIHNLSFVEDPTRIFRAIRFAGRFDFEIGKQTHSLIKNAINLKLLESIDGKRIFNELKLIFEEKNVLKIIKMLNYYRLFNYFHPNLILQKHDFELINRVYEYIKWFELTFPEDKKLIKWVIYLIAILNRLNDDDDFKNSIKKLNMFEKEYKKIINDRKVSRFILKAFHTKKDMKNSDVYELLYNKSNESIIFSLAYTEDIRIQKKIIDYFIKLRFIKPEITGKDLIALGFTPSPLFKTILDTVHQKKLNGELKNYAEEKEFVKQKFLPLIIKDEY